MMMTAKPDIVPSRLTAPRGLAATLHHVSLFKSALTAVPFTLSTPPPYHDVEKAVVDGNFRYNST